MSAFVRKYFLHIYNYFFYLAHAAFLPFIGYWFAEEGLNAQQIGLLFSIGPLVGFLVQPIWGMLIDTFGVTKLILIISTSLTPWIALSYQLADQNFLYYILISVVLAVFASTTVPIIDAMTVRHAKQNNLSYGTIRVLGSISFSLSVTLLGWLYNRSGISLMFSVYIVTMSMMCALTFFIKKEEHPRGTARSGMLKQMIPLLKEPKFLLFLLPVFLAAIGPQLHNAFYSVYISQFGGDVSGRLGQLYAVSALTEIPVFFFSGYVIKKFGYVPTLAAVSAVGAIRWFILSLEPSFGILVFNQVLAGSTYALFFAAGINYAYDMSPESTKTTAHSLFIVVYTNIAGILASNVGGWVIEVGGFTILFESAAFLSLLGAIGFILLGRRKVAPFQHTQKNY
ncbi:MFS transporter [Ammoniphilus sp. YIM 78166]|uniref:MFS transporter n=1 Tax=Ammoniphilus sp. YIM 78166 TaxID=1644106 RepID=UPI00106F6063|nr:MFS transporter [Ammoniphilus sp. YIM 78166]